MATIFQFSFSTKTKIWFMYLAIDIGGTTVKAALLEKNGKILQRVAIPTQGQSNSDFARSLREAIIPLIKIYPPEACGIGSPGPLDLHRGEIISSANMPGVKNFPIVSQVRQIFSEHGFAAPVYLNNDANCAALGELYFGHGKNETNFAVLTLGTGLGGGLILEKKLYSGYQGNGFEIGHVPLPYPFLYPEFKDIPLTTCGCGALGCVETVASATGLVRYYKIFSQKNEDISAQEISKLAEKNEPIALKTFRLIGSVLAGLLCSLTHSLNLPLYIFTGGMAASENFLRPTIEEKLYPSLFPIFRNNTKIVFTRGDENAGILGAAALCI